MEGRLAARRPTVSPFLCSLLLLHASPSWGHAEPFLRGDTNGDGRVDIADPVRLLAHLFLSQPAPGCVDAADANDGGTIDLTDAVFTLTFLFRGGTPPPPPGPYACGFDPTGDVLECEESPVCAGTPQRVIVAVVDSGVEASHPDLAGQLLPGIDLFDRAGNPEDVLGHGTEAAGLVAGIGRVPGECADCLVLPVKVADDLGYAEQDLVAEGIEHAARVGARVILVGLGSRGGTPALADAVARAESFGAVVVAPAGNLATAHTLFPAALPGVVSVVALDGAGGLLPSATTSGFETVGASALDVTTTGLGGGTVERSGSSIAAARVAGIAGHLLAQDPTLTPAQVRQALRHGIEPLSIAGWYEAHDYGRVDAARAAARAAAAPADVAVTRLTVSPARPLVGQRHAVRVRIVNRGLEDSGPLSLAVTVGGAPAGDAVAVPSMEVEGALEVDVELPPAAAAVTAEVRAALAPIPGETATADNARSIAVSYTTDAVHDVDVLAGPIEAPLAEVGTAELPLTVRNRGNQDEASVLLEVTIEDEPISTRRLALAAGETRDIVETWTIGEDLSSRNRGLRIAVSIAAEEASLEGNEWVGELSVGHRELPGKLQYADTPNGVDFVMDAPWITVRPYVPVLFFTPDFTKGGSRALDRLAIGNYVAGAGDFAADIFIDNRLNQRDGTFEADFGVPGTIILDPLGKVRGPTTPGERFGSFWHYLVLVPVQAIGDGGGQGSSGEHFLEVSIEWSFKRFTFNFGGDPYSRVLRVLVSDRTLPAFAEADHYFDAHVHTIAEQTAWDGPVEDTPKRNFGGPIAMLLESSYALGLVDLPFRDDSYDGFKDRIVVTDHNVFYSKEVHRIGGTGATRAVPLPSAPAFGPTSGTNGHQGERDWYRLHLGRLAGEEVALAAGPNQAGAARNEGHHFLAYDTVHIEGPWHGGGFLGSLLNNPNTPLAVLGMMKAESDTGFGYAAHPASAQPWSSQYFDEFLGRPPHNARGGPQVSSNGADFIFKGVQLWNTKSDEGSVENLNLDTGDFVVLNPFPGGPDDQRFQPDHLWVMEHELNLDLYEGLVQSTLIHAFKEEPQRKFIRKVYIVGGSDAHGDFNYSDDVPYGTELDKFLDYATIGGSAYGRVLTYTLVHDRTGPAAGDPAIEAYKEGNSVVTDGPICIVHFDSDGRHNPGGDPRWHDAIPSWRFENMEGRIGGSGAFDGGRTVLVPRRPEELQANGFLRTVWRKSALPLATNIPTYDLTLLTPGARIRSKLAAGAENQVVTTAYPQPVKEVAALMLKGHAPHAIPRRDGRCFTNPIWAVPVPIEVVHTGTCPILERELKVIFHFPLTMAGAGGVFIQPLDGEGNSAGDPIALIPDPGWEPEAGVDSAKYTATNEEQIDCPEELWDADKHVPPDLGDVRAYVVYMSGVVEMHGSVLNDIGRTFNVSLGGTFVALGDSFVAPPGVMTYCDVRPNDVFPRTATFQLVNPPATHADLFHWKGDGTFDIALLSHGGPISFSYRIVEGAMESAVVEVTVNGDPRLLVDLETFTDPGSGKTMVSVPCLVLEGKHYPIHQLRLANNPQDVCREPHWHSPLEVFHLEPPMAGRFDPHPPTCGFGQYKEVPQEAFAVEAAVWEAFLAAHPPLP